MTTQYSQKQLFEVLEQIDKHVAAPFPLDQLTAVKPYGELGHILIRSGVPGCEGEITIHRDSLERLGQVLVAFARARAPEAQREAKKA